MKETKNNIPGASDQENPAMTGKFVPESQDASGSAANPTGERYVPVTSKSHPDYGVPAPNLTASFYGYLDADQVEPID